MKSKPEEYIGYFEDLDFMANAEIGQKDVSEIASNRLSESRRLLVATGSTH